MLVFLILQKHFEKTYFTRNLSNFFGFMTYYFRVSSSSSTDDERILPLEEEEEEGGPLEPDEEEEEGGPLEPNEEEGPEGQIRRRMFRYVMDSSDSEGSPQYICSPLGPGGGD